MSIAGSNPETGPENVTPERDHGAPSPDPVTPASATAARKRAAIFRWRGMGALVAVLVLVAAWWLIFGDRVVRTTLAEAATKSLGTQVDVGAVDVDLLATALELRGIEVAHPFDSTRNILQIGRAHVELERDPLLQKKIIVRSLTLDEVRSDVLRARPARRVPDSGFLPRALREAKQFTAQFKVPLLSLTPIDTIKSLVLDPTQLKTVQSAQALASRADSTRHGAVARVQALRLRETTDSAEALLNRLKDKSPRSLGIIGTRDAVRDVRRLVTRVDSTKKALEALKQNITRSIDSLVTGVRAVEDARKADYAFARSLLALPSFHAPDIGPALFGPVSIDAFERGMYWMMLARDYAPPGLLPRESTGPKRLRRAGTTVRFVTPESYPAFHLRAGSLNLALGESAGAARGNYLLRVSDVTTDPALVGKPLRLSLTRAAANSTIESLSINGSHDPTGSLTHQTIDARLAGLKLPAFSLPALPLRLDLGRGTSTLALNIAGDSISGRWTATAPRAVWQSDAASVANLNTLQQLITRVVSGIDNINVSAEIKGTLRSPSLAVSSNLDNAVADNIKRVAGEEIARAEARVRKQVDELAEGATAAMRAKIAEARTEAEQRVEEATDRLDKARADLAAQLRALGGGLISD